MSERGRDREREREIGREQESERKRERERDNTEESKTAREREREREREHGILSIVRESRCPLLLLYTQSVRETVRKTERETGRERTVRRMEDGEGRGDLVPSRTKKVYTSHILFMKTLDKYFEVNTFLCKFVFTYRNVYYCTYNYTIYSDI